MLSDNAINLSKARLNIAKERIIVAEQNLELGYYTTVANRAYYAAFSAMRAVLALQGFDSKKHSGVIAKFRQDYIATETLPKDLSPIINQLTKIRQGSDYDDFYFISKEEVTKQLQDAKKFVETVEQYLLTQYEQNI
ncbi:MAG: HEPN domain-containing protein [Oscillospiraceae bacterium]|nr:HEPN domain-containing protein [Oscillospiraceae bacterium]